MIVMFCQENSPVEKDGMEFEMLLDIIFLQLVCCSLEVHLAGTTVTVSSVTVK